jgi:hypothetical protein
MFDRSIVALATMTYVFVVVGKNTNVVVAGVMRSMKVWVLAEKYPFLASHQPPRKPRE